MVQKRENLVILGSTGSVGTSTLNVVAQHLDHFEVFALTASTQVELMVAQCVQFKPAFAVMASAVHGKLLEERCSHLGLSTRVLIGAQEIATIAGHPQADIVMAAIVGAAGLAPCLEAARTGKRLLLANKEALVVGGDVFMDAVRRGGATLLPIDSEHSAIFQSLPEEQSTWSDRIEKIILTASGGPFRTTAPAALRSVTPEQACAHPNWVMGRKISVDSATMMNKALEVIEAHYLFGVRPNQIEVLIHPQSVIHSMVQYKDKSVIAQLGTPDMRGPIAYGLAWPKRIASGSEALNFADMDALSFESLDAKEHPKRFPGLKLAWAALAAVPGTTAVLNAANEIGVEAFLSRQIRFDQIHDINLRTLDLVVPQTPKGLGDLLALDSESRAVAKTIMNNLAN